MTVTKWDRVATMGPRVVLVKEPPVPEHVEPIIRRLIETRRAWGLSLTDVAERCGSCLVTFRRYESGAAFPSSKMLTRWADVLGFELNLWPRRAA